MSTAVAEMDRAELDKLLEVATDDEALVILAALEAERFDWSTEARDSQLPPLGEWLVWLILAGRGFGKTRTGAEWTKDQARVPYSRGALVGATLEDIRDTMVEGESGLLSCLPPSALRGGSIERSWNRGPVELYLANGSKLKGFSSEKPDRLRGPQHHFAWGDEPMSWKDSGRGPEQENTTWSNLLLGLRLGSDPRCVVTGTPKPRRLLIGDSEHPGLLRMPGVVVTKGSTYDNLSNLAPPFAERILSRYEGTRTGRQELHAEVLEDVEGALWARGQAAAMQVPVTDLPVMKQITVGVDPSGGDGAANDEVGIVVVGRGYDDHGYVLDDRSGKYGPAGWGQVAVLAALEWGAQRIVGERNYGGAMVEENVRVAIDRLAAESPEHANARSILVDTVWASVGKRPRAEPVAALCGDPTNADTWERTIVHLAGDFPRLVDEMCGWVPDETGSTSPNRLDAQVWATHDLFAGLLGGGVPRTGTGAPVRRSGRIAAGVG